ncbi:uncharacterized protein G2W53_023025 [Senna tora]|uniref:Uncharacterized protein n=1 Tax=Senna tora TaxID=362788 RepID=A0A834TQ39_9FABA|nr:uncharacterized protein G2W53_023025 [Senna tora]
MARRFGLGGIRGFQEPIRW